MKSVISVVFLFIFFILSFVQAQQSQNDYLSGNMLCIDAGGLIFESRIAGEYERLISIWKEGPTNGGISISLNYLNKTINDVKTSGIGGIAAFRFYFTQEAPAGLWIGIPYLGIVGLNHKYQENEASTGVYGIAGGMLGYNFVIGRIPTMYLSFGAGAGYYFGTSDVSGYGPFNMPQPTPLIRAAIGIIF